MSVKHIKISKTVHKKLLELKQDTEAKSISDVIEELILISEDYYISRGRLKVNNKEVILRYNSEGKLIEICIK